MQERHYKWKEVHFQYEQETWNDLRSRTNYFGKFGRKIPTLRHLNPM